MMPFQQFPHSILGGLDSVRDDPRAMEDTRLHHDKYGIARSRIILPDAHAYVHRVVRRWQLWRALKSQVPTLPL
jgi:hypothetical protein